jgi:hypothetical protein
MFASFLKRKTDGFKFHERRENIPCLFKKVISNYRESTATAARRATCIQEGTKQKQGLFRYWSGDE